MYLEHFGLNQPPFKITPNTGFFYTGGNRGAILDALLYAVTHGEGIIKVTGEIGSGKTMLCRMLESLLPDNVEAIYLANPSLNREEIFHVIAAELGIATGEKRPSEAIRLMQDYLIEKHAAGKQVVLLVEEAQAMPLDTLEEIRLLSNLETAHHKLLQIVLFGQPELDENLNLPRIRQLKERITHSFKVPPLVQADMPDYLMFRMRAAGYRGPDIFSTGAIKLIASASQGITRRINILADKALLAAFSENTHNILPRHARAAIDDSEFGRSPKLACPSFSGAARTFPPFRKIGLAVALLGLGMLFGAGWQHLASSPRIFETPAPAPAAQPAAKPAAEAAPSPAALGAQPQDKVSPAPSLLQQRLDATQTWLASENGTHYTVQLMLVTDTDTAPQMEQILEKIDREIGLQEVFVYPANITAERQFSITFGNFSSREQAIAARDSLPASYQTNHPILRTVKGIREEIKEQQSKKSS